MPFIEVKTNVGLEKKIKDEIVKEAGSSIGLLNKTEDWLMINVIDKQSMYFKGSDEACLIVEVKLYGQVNPSAASSFTKRITSVAAKLTGVKEERIYVSYFGTSLWGYSGFNF